MSREQENKEIVGRWFTEFWGNAILDADHGRAGEAHLSAARWKVSCWKIFRK